MYEYELEAELEGEFENEFEWEGEWEGEFEGELEGEYEGGWGRAMWGAARRNPLLAGAATLAAGAAASPMGQRVLPVLRDTGWDMARTGVGHFGDIGGAIGGEPGTPGHQFGRQVGDAAGNYVRSRWLPPQREFEGEWEFEGEVNPLRRVYPDALMEHLGHAATAAQTEEEAEAFIGALIPLAARLIPRIAPVVMRAAPQLIRGAANVTRVLRSNPATRQLVRAVPNIVRRTAASMAQQVSQGKPVTPTSAVQTLARQTASVIGSPQRCAHALQRSRALDRQHHRAVGPVASAVTPRGAAMARRRASYGRV
jgi:hypothetical protein